MKRMIATTDVSTIAHLDKTYRPGKDGVFEIEDGDVDALRAHGLVLEEEGSSPNTPSAKGGKKASAEQAAALAEKDARIAELEAQLAAKG